MGATTGRFHMIAVAATVTVLFASATTVRADHLAEAAAGLAGTSVRGLVLDRPAWRAVIERVPEFERATGIRVELEIVAYEDVHDREVEAFRRGGSLTMAVVDLVWLGEFVEAGWLEPLDDLATAGASGVPGFDYGRFAPGMVDALARFDGTLWAVPFDAYAGVLFYDACRLRAAGLPGPPRTWDELKDVHGPRLTDPAAGRYAFAMASLRGEAQTTDSFLRMLAAFGGRLMDDDFRSALGTPEARAALAFRQALGAVMPPAVAGYDHAETLQALARREVAMVTEWSAFHDLLADPAESGLGDCLAVAPEPEGPAGRRPPIGGFALGVVAGASPKERAATRLFLQWATSSDLAQDFADAGGISANTNAYDGDADEAAAPLIAAVLSAWRRADPAFRPRIAAWPALSDAIADVGWRIQAGRTPIEAGLAELGGRIDAILAAEGYRDAGRRRGR
ncbi:ABC transporter substrate-binding protein [Oharaeibacter diazotrophicus]|uniref:Carbohydrate ABC transporter substrate-binding protein (CUT1 family) n=1 Tax=Oharaeibacter diazotrophicus TaxID=1920512 RepID=A0A4R6R8T8_9HYPH|nr:extracellular solute-binding protein [Oharaeibacter diazotrophicus]TDP82453.1 carbohydrate ABC transporter substrate-binding protein (CUT1 family) [Oharaeibacter diazotrophicus]BBE72784.1 putative ABC transporter-binding protein precursor [Pleomorphomonas sp. SM30]GLS76822.1 ABC transporter substrate-binding protein [Oharaeibacter diazotrophicus]